MKELIDRLEEEETLTDAEWVRLLTGWTREDRSYAAQKARKIARERYGNKIYIRGLIEFTDYCRNNCYYCGIRRGNSEAERYRLDEDTILACCSVGYELGFRTFVLQGGEDVCYTKERMVGLIRRIKAAYPDCALTLSTGEWAGEAYQEYFDAGADRFLLRHETADREHYERLHPPSMNFDNRMRCLKDLKRIGFQTGCGFMVGSPYQTPQTLAEDMEYIHSLHPQMVGIGPFLPQKDTPFGGEPAGGYELTLFLLSLIRIMEKDVLLPATTALGTLRQQGREEGILAGANVVMPNLSPPDVRGKYLLYDNKLCTGSEAAECLRELKQRMTKIGYEVVAERGDWKGRADDR